MIELSVPYKRAICKTNQRYRELIKIWNGKKNLYRSVYHFQLKNDKPNFDDIIINQIFLDFDNDNSHEITIKFAQELLKDNIKFRINFSGRRGFHFYISCEHKDINKKSYLTALYQYIINKYNIEKDIDSHVIGNIKQLRRIENTLNIKGNLYCISITFQELIFLNFNEIKELAENPRNFEICWIEGKDIKLDNINIDSSSINENYKVESSNGEFKEINDVLPDPCIVRILHFVHPLQDARFLLCLWLSDQFRNGKDINDFDLKELSERIISFMKSLNWDDFSEALNTSKSSRYQVNNIINKKYNFVPNCNWRKSHNLCNSEYCWEEKQKGK